MTPRSKGVLVYGQDIKKTESDPVFPYEFHDLRGLKTHLEGLMDAMRGPSISAPQVGVFKQFFVIFDEKGAKIDFVNPYITQMYGRESMVKEGCISLPPVGNTCLVPRLEHVVVQYSTVEDPEKVKIAKFSGKTAVIIQHEYDHICGSFFIDRVSEQSRRVVMQKFNNWKETKTNVNRTSNAPSESSDCQYAGLHGLR